MKTKLTVWVVIVVLIMGCTFSGCGSNKGNDKIVIAVMTSESSNSTEQSPYEDLGNYLEQKLGIEVEVYEIGSYEAGIEALRTGKADMNLFSAFSYYLANQRADIEPLVSVSLGEGSDIGNTILITQADSEINSIADLEGHSFAFVDPASTSGHIAPKYYLMQEFGVTASELENNIFSQISFAGGHDTSLIGVANGQYDAGACVKMVLNRIIEAGMIEEGAIKVLGETSLEGNGSAMVIRSEVSEELKQDIKEALLEYNNPEFFAAVLSSPDATFCEVDKEGLAKIEDVAVALDLSEEQLLQ